MAQAYITLVEVKTLLGITDSSQDNLITALLPIIKSDFIEETNNPMVDADGVDNWAVGTQLVLSQMIGQMLTDLSGGLFRSESEGGYSYTRENQIGGYSESIMGKLQKYRLASLVKGTITTQYRDRRWTSLKQLANDFAYRNEPNVAFGDQNL